MRRIQNILLVLWVLLAVALGLFNWGLLSRSEPVRFLFTEFELRWGLWLVALAGFFPVLMRLLAWTESRLVQRRSMAELQRLKAKAFDEHGGDLEMLARNVQERVVNGVRDLLSRSGSGSASAPSGTPKA
jgi:hypothetical protein